MDGKDHEELLKVLLQHKGAVLISGYETDLYNNMLSGWTKVWNTSYSQVHSQKKEVLWLNFKPVNIQMDFKDFGICQEVQERGRPV